MPNPVSIPSSGGVASGTVAPSFSPEIPSDAADSKTKTTTHAAGVQSETVVTTLPKLTTSGKTGSVTEVNGKVTAYTSPT